MTFDNNRVYTAVNADELEVGSMVIAADTLGDLKDRVQCVGRPEKLVEVLKERNQYRFKVISGREGASEYASEYALAYLVEERAKLKWTDLKVGDVIQYSGQQVMVTQIDRRDNRHLHIYAGVWIEDKDLEAWEKVNENDNQDS